MADRPTGLLAGLEEDAMHAEAMTRALVALLERCEREGIPFAVIGALAMRHSGYRRYTTDIDILTTPEGLDLIHERLIGRGMVPRAPGLRKSLRDTVHGVDVDVLAAGEHAGSPESPVVYPDPRSDAFARGDDGIPYATLDALIEFKLASGIWGNRPKDLVDVQELIKANALDEGFADRLPEPVRAAFRERVRASRLERDIE